MSCSRTVCALAILGLSGLAGPAHSEELEGSEVNALAQVRLVEQALDQAVDRSVFILDDMQARREEGDYGVCDIEYFLMSTSLYTVRHSVKKLGDGVEEAALIKPSEFSETMQAQAADGALRTKQLLDDIGGWQAFCAGKVGYEEDVAAQKLNVEAAAELMATLK
ncbi:MAG: hypothetical protein AAGB03_04385 [Pseudomonadota bacterium]